MRVILSCMSVWLVLRTFLKTICQKGTVHARRVLVPPFWNSVSALSFSFTPFLEDSVAGIKLYEWGLGSQAGLADVVPFKPVNGTRTVRVPAMSLNYSVSYAQLVQAVVGSCMLRELLCDVCL